ncbi:glycosyltransferase family 4 protein [Actinokineospora soli]|uniref:Glycosyltransferase family 4 protein n=1 Tax=Actinokineospora soli TaxID=1048753 RepID=A0ABW2TZI1_9PSEU
MPEPAPAGTVGCAVATAATAPAARVVARSYLDHHPDHGFTVLVLDEADPAQWADLPGCRVVGPGFLDVDGAVFGALATAYDAGELADAVAPLLLRALLADHATAVLLGVRTLVCAPFDDISGLAAEHDIVLAPRMLLAPGYDGLEPDAEDPHLGAFDPDFLVVGAGAKPFVDWWAARATTPSEQVDRAVKRRTVDAVPALFRHHVTRDPGVGIGYWNLHERDIQVDGDAVAVDGTAVRLVHFTGFQADTPWLLAPELKRPRVRLSDRPAVADLVRRYRALLGEPPLDETYGLGLLDDGEPVLPTMRALFLHEWTRFTAHEIAPGPFEVQAPAMPPHAFTGTDAFRRWLREPGTPADAAAGISRLAAWVWSSRPDLRVAFPEPASTSAAGFRNWCAVHGVDEGALPEWAVPSGPARLPAPPEDVLGVNVAGYLTAELGLGQMGRIVLKAIEAADIPVVSVVEVESLNGNVRTGIDRPSSAGAPRHPVSVLAVNADYTRMLLDNHPEVGHDRYVIGLWAWELEDFPTHLHTAFPLVNEIWTVSDFCRATIGAHSPVPVHTIPVPVLDPGPVTRAPRRAGDETRFLFAFDFNSTGQRKNPWGVVTAFQRAFPGRTDVRLVIKATNSHLHVGAAERLRHAVAGDDRVELVDRYLSVEELDELYAGSHAYVSLHRSEGFGLTVAEAMARGMAVVSTDYSSTTEFVDESVGWPIPYRMVPVGKGWEPYQAEGRWADPDLDAAAAALRQIADDPAEAERRGRAAREHVLRTRSVERAAEWMRERVTAAHEAWRAGARPAGALAVEDVAALGQARQALHSAPDPGAPSRLPFASTMRRAVLRALAQYDGHQRTRLTALLDGVRDAVHGVTAKVDRVAEQQSRRIAAVEADAERRYRELAERIARMERE